MAAKTKHPYLLEDVASRRQLYENTLRDKQAQWTATSLAIEAAERVLRKAKTKKLAAVVHNAGVHEQVEPQLKAQLANLFQQREELQDSIDVAHEMLDGLPDGEEEADAPASVEPTLVTDIGPKARKV